MLIKIIWLHVSLELPDGDCIGGRLQLESFLSSFYFPYPKKEKKGKKKKGRFGVYGMAVWGVPVTVHSASACV